MVPNSRLPATVSLSTYTTLLSKFFSTYTDFMQSKGLIEAESSASSRRRRSKRVSLKLRSKNIIDRIYVPQEVTSGTHTNDKRT